MSEIITILEKASPIGVIALLAIAILLLIKGGYVNRKQSTEKKEDEEGNDEIVEEKIDIILINKKLNKIMGNHLHDLPEMKKALERIEGEQVKQGREVSGLKAQVDILIKKII